ncbi:hypothetical protein PQ459_10280 [Chryseobacterium sp. KACC 21268]|nr:hypothetical protein PQ459_10280 [Chryseobacterium sp. KACC 21268]
MGAKKPITQKSVEKMLSKVRIMKMNAANLEAELIDLLSGVGAAEVDRKELDRQRFVANFHKNLVVKNNP